MTWMTHRLAMTHTLSPSNPKRPPRRFLSKREREREREREGEKEREREGERERAMRSCFLMPCVSVLSLVDTLLEDKLEERFFHDCLNCLVERGGETLRRGVPYIYERVCSIPSERYNGKFILKVQVRRREKERKREREKKPLSCSKFPSLLVF